MSFPAVEGRVVHVLGPLPYDAYVGRAMPRLGIEAGVFANPYKIGKNGNRDEVLRKYEESLDGRLERPISAVDMNRGVLREWPTIAERELLKLRGKVLACWCADKGEQLTADDELVCHGQILLRRIRQLAADDEPEEGNATRIEDLRVKAYALSDTASIERRGEDAWAVVDGGLVLNQTGEWEYEPSPSNRDEAFLKRARFRTAEEALDVWRDSARPLEAGTRRRRPEEAT